MTFAPREAACQAASDPASPPPLQVETPSRADALRFYTAGSAWVSHDEDIRGSLEVGKQADVTVIDASAPPLAPFAVGLGGSFSA